MQLACSGAIICPKQATFLHMALPSRAFDNRDPSYPSFCFTNCGNHISEDSENNLYASLPLAL